MSRPARAVIDLPALRHNYALARRLSGAGRTLPIIKANAYGHGAVLVGQTLEPLAPALGVACIEEAVALREAGLRKPLLVLEGCFRAEELALASRQDFWLMIHNEQQLAALEKAYLPAPVTCWLKIDTGMHRLGFAPPQAATVFNRLKEMTAVAEEIVLATHFSSADQLDSDVTPRQIRCFQDTVAGLDAPHSLANSPALLAWPQARAAWNRPGFMLYGNSPFPEPHPETGQLRAVMTFRSEIMALRELAAGESVGYANTWTASQTSRIAIVAGGYGDGYPRQVSSQAAVMINGRRAKLAGRVSMDMISVDVTHLGKVKIGDEVIFWGDEPSLNEVAGWAATSGYEILTRMPGRVPRSAGAAA